MGQESSHFNENLLLNKKLKYLSFIAFSLWFFLLFYLFIGEGSFSGVERVPFMERILYLQREALLILLFLMKKYFILPFLKKVTQSYLEILFLVAILVCSFFLGRLLVGRWKRWPRVLEIEELLPISIGFGLWVFSLLAIFLTLSGLLVKGLVIAFIIGLLIIFFVYLEIRKRKYRERSEDVSMIDKETGEKGSPFDRFLIILILLCLLLAFFFSLRPPIHYDALEYHLAVPSELIKNNAFKYFPYDVHTNFPLTVEMMYLLALLISGWKIAHLINFAFLPLFLILIYAFGKRFFEKRAALIGTALFASTYAIMDLSTHPLVDLEFGFFTVASFILLVLWRDEKGNRFFYLSALSTGIALGIKYTTLVLTLPLNLLFVILFLITKRREGAAQEKIGQDIWKFVAFALIVFAIASPWLIRNSIDTGNPLFPIGSNMLGWEKWTPEQDRMLKEAANVSMNLEDVLTLPWRISFSERDFGSSSFIGPVYLLFLPLLFFYRKKGVDYVLILYCLLYFLLWGFTFNMVRFAVPLLAILALLLGKSIRHYAFDVKSNLIKSAICTFVVIFISTNFLYFIVRQAYFPKSARVILGQETESRFLSQYVEYYGSIQYFNSRALEDSKILFVGETRSFFTDREAVWSSAYNKNPIIPIVQSAETPDDIAEALITAGFSHILYAPQGLVALNKSYNAYPFSKEELRRFHLFLLRRAKRLYNFKGAFLFQIQKPSD